MPQEKRRRIQIKLLSESEYQTYAYRWTIAVDIDNSTERAAFALDMKLPPDTEIIVWNWMVGK